jgi:hypothetical protein
VTYPLRSGSAAGERGPRPLPNGLAPAAAHRPIVPTSSFMGAQTKIAAAVAARRICALDGELGTGKSTVAGFYAGQSGRQCRLVEIPSDSSSRESLVHIYVQLTGHQPVGTKLSIRSDLYDILSSDDYVMLLDEAQNLGAAGFRQIRNLWDRCKKMGRPFPLIICGFGVHATLAKVPELKSRVSVWHTMSRLGTEELPTVLRALHPRLAVTDEDLLLRIDLAYARGNLRQWDDFLEILDTVSGPPTASPKPLTRAEALRTLITMGHPEVKL